MDAPIPDFDAEEQRVVASVLLQRYGKIVPLQFADSELQLDPASEVLAVCPTLYWTERGAHFVLCKVAPGAFRCQFFYSDAEHYGIGDRSEFADLEECVLTLLRVQSDHERQRANVFSGATGSDLGESEYLGPEII
jgi:hypothetical protein